MSKLQTINKPTSAWQLCFTVMLGALVVIIPDLLYAQEATAMEMGICSVTHFLQSGTGKALATVAVTIIGIGALLGKVSWGMALLVAVGVATIFGAGSIVLAITSDSTTCLAHGSVNVK